MRSSSRAPTLPQRTDLQCAEVLRIHVHCDLMKTDVARPGLTRGFRILRGLRFPLRKEKHVSLLLLLGPTQGLSVPSLFSAELRLPSPPYSAQLLGPSPRLGPGCLELLRGLTLSQTLRLPPILNPLKKYFNYIFTLLTCYIYQ